MPYLSVSALFALLVLVSVPAFSQATVSLHDFVASPQGEADLDSLTGFKESLNKVTLLHLGENSWPVRLQYLQQASNYVLVSVPFWYDDVRGGTFADLLKAKSTSNPQFVSRVMQDWTSPFYGNGSKTIENEFSKEILYWNSPTWQRNFSYDFKEGHLHDKMLVFDGQAMIVGGMNICDSYLEGGENAAGWHDTDVLLEGPVAQDGAAIYLKIWQLGKYLASDLPFPPFQKEEIQALQSYFYQDQEDHDFYTVQSEPPARVLNKVHIPIKDILSDPFYFPKISLPPEEAQTPVRLIYDNALINRDPKTGKGYSNVRNTLDYLLAHAQKSAWFFIPYLTPDQDFFNLLTEAAKRLDLVIVTNSANTWDVSMKGYADQVGHYSDSIKAGVRLYEWQGDGPVLAALAKGCQLPAGEWPGQTLHSKAVLLDGEVALIGSDNLNHQSLGDNNEVMALINDPQFGSQVQEIFLNDLERGRTRPSPLICPDPSLIPVETIQVDQNLIQNLTVKYKVGKPTSSYPLGL